MNSTFFKSNLFLGLLQFIFFILVFSYTNVIHHNQSNKYNSDFGTFYESSQFYLQHKNPYSTIYLQQDGVKELTPKTTATLGANLNPPFFQLLILPLNYFFNFSHAFFIWNLLSIMGALSSMLLFFKVLNGEWPSARLFFAGLILLFIYMPTFTNFFFAELTFMMLPLLMGAWFAAHRHQYRSLGIWLGIAASIKLFFGLFAIYFLIRKEYKAFFWFSGTILVCSLLPLVFSGHVIYLEYHHSLQRIIWFCESLNASVYGFLVRMFGANEFNIPVISIPGLANKIYWIIFPLTVGVIARFLKPNSLIKASDKINLDFSIILVGMLLLSPLGWNYYFPFLIVPAGFIFQKALQNYRPLTMLFALLVFLILCAHPQEYSPLHNVQLAPSKAENNFIALTFLFAFLFYLRKVMMKDSAVKDESLSLVPLSDNTEVKSAASLSKPLMILILIIGFVPSFVSILNIDVFNANPKNKIPDYHILRVQG